MTYSPDSTQALIEATVAKLWPWERSWPQWSPQELLDLWLLHQGDRKPAKAKTDKFCRLLMMGIALWLSHRDRIGILDRIGVGSEDWAMEQVAFIHARAGRFTFEKTHPLVAVKSLNTALHRRFADALDAAQHHEVDISAMEGPDGEDPTATMPDQPTVRSDAAELLLLKLCDMCPEMVGEVEVMRELWRHQASQLITTGSLSTYSGLPRGLKKRVTKEMHLVVTVELHRVARNLLSDTAA